MCKKYKLTSETKTFGSHTLYQIQALKTFGTPIHTIRAGEYGGWVESEKNLSQTDGCWIFDGAQVRGDSQVYGNAQVFGGAQVYGKARIGSDARVYGKAQVCGNAQVGGCAQVYGDAFVGGSAHVWGDARIYSNAQVYDNAQVYGSARVYGDAFVGGSAQVYGNARISGRAHVSGNANIVQNGDIRRSTDSLVIGPIGSRNDHTTFYRTASNKIQVVCGCFTGSIDQFLAAAKKKHGDNHHGKMYKMAAELARAQILEGNKE
ncbi:MAG: hypothetical protein SOX70_07965 [Peptoniphilaceae bacterium]|nr:hypothetical protein [Peptoniphilaceae bacterium]